MPYTTMGHICVEQITSVFLIPSCGSSTKEGSTPCNYINWSESIFLYAAMPPAIPPLIKANPPETFAIYKII